MLTKVISSGLNTLEAVRKHKQDIEYFKCR